MAIQAKGEDAARVLTDIAKFPLRIGSHAARSGVETGLHLGEHVVAAGVKVGEEVERPAVAAMRAAGIEADSVLTARGTKVDYDFFAGVTPEILNPGGTLPGANEWDRPLSKAHPNPVVLMHGTAGGAQTNWGAYVPLLVEQGFSPFTMTFGAVSGRTLAAVGAGRNGAHRGLGGRVRRVRRQGARRHRGETG